MAKSVKRAPVKVKRAPAPAAPNAPVVAAAVAIDAETTMSTRLPTKLLGAAKAYCATAKTPDGRKVRMQDLFQQCIAEGLKQRGVAL